MKRLVAMSLLLFAVSCTTPAPRPHESSGEPKAKTVMLDPAVADRLGVRAEPAGLEGPALRLELPGTLEYASDKYAEVGSVVEGRISAIHVNVGDRVRKDQPLATVLIPAIVNAQADVLAARAAVEVTADNLKRETALLENQLTTKREAELARGEATKAQAELAAATAKLSLLGAAVPSTSDKIRANGALTLRAPIDGIVVRRDAAIGAFIEPKDTVLVVADASTMWALVDVYESDIGTIPDDADVELRVDALHGRVLHGRMAMLGPRVGKDTRAVHARVVVDNADGALRPGLFLRASVPIAASPAGERLLVPKAAIQPIGGGDVVFVEKERGRYDVRDVRVTRRTSQLAEIGDGLAMGERIVVHGAFVLRGEVTKQ